MTAPAAVGEDVRVGRDDRVRLLRLAAQRLTASTAEADVTAAAHAVVGVQAQDVRAAGLALRCRVPGVGRGGVDRSGLVRTWTVRGTLHLVGPADVAWLHAVIGRRNLVRFDAAMTARGDRDVAVGMLDDLVDILSGLPLDRAALLRELARRGRPPIGSRAMNVLMPWVAAQGLVLGLPDGRYRATGAPPEVVDPDLALATLAHRYLAGYGPATPADLASWSGLPLTTARRAVDALGRLDTVADRLALPGTLDGLDGLDPDVPAVHLLPAFDTTMLGHRTRGWLVPPEHDRRVLPGGGMVRPVVLVAGVAAGTWGTTGRGRSRRTVVDWFDGRGGTDGDVAVALAREERAVLAHLDDT